MIDHYIYGNCVRISPEAPVQVVEINKEQHTLGGAGNVLKNLVSFNCEVDIISVIGEDDAGALVLSELQTMGISADGILKDKGRRTTIKSRVIASYHHLIRLDRETLTEIDPSLVQEIVQKFNQKVDSYDIVLLSDYNKGVLTNDLLTSIFSVCKEKKITTIVDPKGVDFKKYKGANIIKPNKKEASLATGIEITDQSQLKEACQHVQRITSCDNVIVTLSDEGIASYAQDKLTVIPTKVLDVIDVTGAGDTVLASLAVSLVDKKSIHDACDFANKAAAIVVSKLGSAVTTYEEIEKNFNYKK